MDKQAIEVKRVKIAEQSKLLQEVKKQLKQEFVGLDNIIDRIVENVSSWLFFPEMQDRPVIVNLWGLTGTGKTSLVKRLTELLGFEHRYYNFDMAVSNDKYFDLEDKLDEIYNNCNGEPFIIGLDEFQHARTLNEEQVEIDKSSIRDVWKLLDNGKLEIIRFDYYLNNLSKLIKKLDFALSNNVEVVNGLVVENAEAFKNIFETDTNKEVETGEEDSKDKSEPLYFITEEFLNSPIYYIVEKEYLSLNDLRKKLNTFNGEQTIEFLIDLYKQATKPKLVDCSKSLVFVMGNLDEVYCMNKNFNPDIAADEFYEQSLEITIPQVKNALLSRFRSEQIARLGNTHIIYPALNEKAFYVILGMELAKITEKVKTLYQVNLTFDTSVEKLLYSEGVIPTQGTRPLFTTVHQVIKSRLGLIINEFYQNAHTATEIRLFVKPIEKDKENITLEIVYSDGGKEIHRLEDKVSLDLGKLRQEKQDDVQALVAVHESGHAVLSSILLRTLPESIFSVTADSNSGGFVISKTPWKYISKKEIVKQLAVLLGGFVAERIVFGEENVTLGSTSDISAATEFIINSLYNSGMGDVLASFGNEHISSTHDIIYDRPARADEVSLNQKALIWIQEAEALAEETLRSQMTFLLQLADYLSDNRFADKELVKDYMDKYAVGFSSEMMIDKENAHQLFYRNHLKEKVATLR